MEKQVSGAEITINAPIQTVWHAITNSQRIRFKASARRDR